ncbi:substrate-binding domain-containing protein [Rhodobacterales bacterium HKCCE3408]|nr:substrate-binding domain-containing protein [Rhodobacterales bacterium HKCCE3408]
MNLKELAASLNLSPTTVSRALNGYPEVRAETRARVLEAAEAANYRPNSRARRLAMGRSMAIGHVISLSEEAQMINPIFADFLAGAGEVYAREGYDLVLSIVPQDQEAAAYRQLAASGSVDGLMIQAPRCQEPRLPLLKELGLPFIVHGRTDTASDHPWLDIANRSAFKQATNFLLDLGHRRIALVNGLEQFDYAARRRRGYLEALEARGIAPDPAIMRGAEMTESYGYASAAEFLDSDDPPTAFLASSILPAIGIRRAAGERGLRLGRDVSVIAHDDVLSYLYNDGDGPAFTATRSPIRKAGQRCAELLIAQIGAPGGAPVQELWQVELTVGRTTGPCPAT